MKAILIVGTTDGDTTPNYLLGGKSSDFAVLNIRGKGPNELQSKAQAITKELFKRKNIDTDVCGSVYSLYYNMEFPTLDFAKYSTKYGVTGDYSMLPEYVSEAKLFVINRSNR